MQSFELSPGYISWPQRYVLSDDASKKTGDKVMVVGISTAILALIFGPALLHAAHKKRRRRAR